MGPELDGNIQARVDQFRGNPQALQQRFAQNNDLLDLLALQKLVSEKEDAKRDMLLQSGQGGGLPTVVQQLEQQAMGLTKEELLRQRAGTMATEDAKRQQAIQQLMSSGIGSLNAPIPTMAEGGLVSYAEGGEVDEDEDEEDGGLSSLADYVPTTLTPMLEGSPEQYRQFLESVASNTGGKFIDWLREMNSKFAADDESFVPTTTSPSIQSTPEFYGRFKDAIQANGRRSPTGDGNGIEVLSRTGPQGTPPLPDAGGGFNASYRGAGDIDPFQYDEDAANKAGDAYASRFTNLDKEAAGVREGLASLYDSQMDPETLRRDQLLRFLTNAGGRSSLAGGLAAGSGAAQELRGEQQALQRSMDEKLGTLRLAELADQRDVQEGAYEATVQGKLEQLNAYKAESERVLAEANEAMAMAQNDANKRTDLLMALEKLGSLASELRSGTVGVLRQALQTAQLTVADPKASRGDVRQAQIILDTYPALIERQAGTDPQYAAVTQAIEQILTTLGLTGSGGGGTGGATVEMISE